MKTLYLFIVYHLFTVFLQATPQSGDTLHLHDGTRLSVYGFHFSKAASEKLNAYRAKKGYQEVMPSYNWDGYYAYLQIQNEQLFLTQVKVHAFSEAKQYFLEEVPLTLLFGRKGPISADWFSGQLLEYFGKSLDYTHVQSHVRVYTFEKGRFIGVQSMKTKKLRRHSRIFNE